MLSRDLRVKSAYSENRQNAVCPNVEFLNVAAAGTYSYHCTLSVHDAYVYHIYSQI